MSIHTPDLTVVEAQRQINEILRLLEKQTGSVVEGLSLDRIEVTTCADQQKVYQVTSVIELKRNPAQNWSV